MFFQGTKEMSNEANKPEEVQTCARGTQTHRLADIRGSDVHALVFLAVAAASTSVDRHAGWFIEGVCGCPKLFPHI